jgi:hypothetical protein
MLFTDYNYSLVLTQALDMVLDMTATTYATVDYFCTRNKELSVAKLSSIRDDLNMSAFIIDNAIMEIVLTALGARTALDTAALSLDSFGKVTVKGGQFSRMALAKDEAFETPSPAVMEKLAMADVITSFMREATDIMVDREKLAVEEEADKKKGK